MSYRDKIETPEERADRLEMELGRAHRAKLGRAVVTIALACLTVLVSSAYWTALEELDTTRPQARAALQDARELGNLLPVMSRLKTLCQAELARAEEQRDICVAESLHQGSGGFAGALLLPR